MYRINRQFIGNMLFGTYIIDLFDAFKWLIDLLEKNEL